jgi:hypothetical protein
VVFSNAAPAVWILGEVQSTAKERQLVANFQYQNR